MNIAPGHDSVADELNAYIDGELDAAQRDHVSAHIRECERCRADLADLSRTKMALTQLPQLRAPRPFTLAAPVGPGAEPERFGARAKETGAARGGWLSGLLAVGWRLSSLAATVCLLLALWSGVAAPTPSRSDLRQPSTAFAPPPALRGEGTSGGAGSRSAAVVQSENRAPADAPAQAPPQSPALAPNAPGRSLTEPRSDSADRPGAGPVVPAPSLGTGLQSRGDGSSATIKSGPRSAREGPEGSLLWSPILWVVLAGAFGAGGGVLYLLARNHRGTG